MPDLYHSLLKHDPGQLRIIAELWGLELDSGDAEAAREKLVVSLLEPVLAAEIIGALPPEADAAIATLVNSGGRIPWPTFVRKFGDIREAGAGKRDREKLYQNPASAAEVLFYRGILGRAFFDTEKGPQEFAYIPDDLLSLIPRKPAAGRTASRVSAKSDAEQTGPAEAADAGEPEANALGRPASPRERGREVLAGDSILDDAVTLLAARRIGLPDPDPDSRLQSLLSAAGILKKDVPQTDALKAFLEAPRPEALKMLTEAWVESETFNELRQIPGLVCEGEWKNEPQETREFLLNLLDAIPEGKWWSLSAFVRDIKQDYADFQRPAGDYDSWFIRRETDGQYLRGFAHWDEVDGRLIRYFITDLLPWLGQVDLCFAEGASEPTAFRIRAADAQTSQREDGKLHVSSQGVITVPRLAPRVVRYQVSRFCDWEQPKDDVYRYRVTTTSLARAREQGLKVEHLLALLANHAEAGIPPALVKALKRWEVSGTEARVQTQAILKVTRPEVLEELRKSKAARFLGEALSPTTVVVKSGAIQKVIGALAEMGLLAEVESGSE